MWKLLGRSKPEKNPERRQVFWKAFQKLWVAGTLGALFFSIARNLPDHISQATFPLIWNHPFWEYTLSVWLKYLYVAWLIAYFLVSAMDNEHPASISRPRDIFFDVVQSTASIVAAFCLGFIIAIPDLGVAAYRGPLGAIALICFLSLGLFYANARTGVNALRTIGGVLAAIGLALTYVSKDWGLWLYISLFVLQIMLWFTLLAYLRIGFDEPPIPAHVTAAEAPEKSTQSLLEQATAAATLATSHAANATQEALKAVQAAERLSQAAPPKS